MAHEYVHHRQQQFSQQPQYLQQQYEYDQGYPHDGRPPQAGHDGTQFGGPHVQQPTHPQHGNQASSGYYTDAHANEVPEMAVTDSGTSWFSLASAYIPSLPLPTSLPSLPFLGGGSVKLSQQHSASVGDARYSNGQEAYAAPEHVHVNHHPSQHPSYQPHQYQQAHPHAYHQQQQQDQQQDQQVRGFAMPRSLSDTFLTEQDEVNPAATSTRRSIRRTISTYLFTDNAALPTTHSSLQQQQQQSTTSVSAVVGGLSKRVSSWALTGKNSALRLAGYEVEPEQALQESRGAGLYSYGGSEHQVCDLYPYAADAYSGYPAGTNNTKIR
ncbi:hypothetical protein BC830DRAFT_208690 [Chytriomyces sp. MP71]|nr:hypothetical protein BC830DRAFT_208690 [Chytriomyces sp. MP71]